MGAQSKGEQSGAPGPGLPSLMVTTIVVEASLLRFGQLGKARLPGCPQRGRQPETRPTVAECPVKPAAQVGDGWTFRTGPRCRGRMKATLNR